MNPEDLVYIGPASAFREPVLQHKGQQWCRGEHEPGRVTLFAMSEPEVPGGRAQMEHLVLCDVYEDAVIGRRHYRPVQIEDLPRLDPAPTDR